jgi:hypothetical protein
MGVETERGRQDVSSQRDSPITLSRIPRHKVRISRAALLDSARQVLEMFVQSSHIIEVEYFGEVGVCQLFFF